MIWLSAIRSKFGQLLAAFVVFLVAAFAIRRNGASDALREAQEKDYENADSIRRNVERSLDQRVRDYEGRGFRDE